MEILHPLVLVRYELIYFTLQGSLHCYPILNFITMPRHFFPSDVAAHDIRREIIISRSYYTAALKIAYKNWFIFVSFTSLHFSVTLRSTVKVCKTAQLTIWLTGKMKSHNCKLRISREHWLTLKSSHCSKKLCELGSHCWNYTLTPFHPRKSWRVAWPIATG